MTSTPQDFPRIQTQGKWLACIYKGLGLYSIPLLTLVTILSLTNVYTAGQFIHVAGIQYVWAIIFSGAIEVNSVRLFLESVIDDDTPAFVIALLLSIVAGAALLIEGLQQSIGLSWQSGIVQWIVAGLVALRVLCVVILLGREGRKLGHSLKQKMLVQSAPIAVSGQEEVSTEQAPIVDTQEPLLTDIQFVQEDEQSVDTQEPEPMDSTLEHETKQQQAMNVDTEPVQEDEPITDNIRAFPVQKRGQSKRSPMNTAEKRIRKYASEHPELSNRAIAKKIGVSPSTVTKYLKNEQQATSAEA